MDKYQHQHRVRYQETDQMGVVHHANYLHWFEEARTEYLRAQGLSYRQLEEQGVLLPVREANCSYHQAANYDQLVTVEVEIKELKRVQVTFSYQLRVADQLLVTGSTIHPFVNQNFELISLKREMPEIWNQIFSN